MGYMLHHTIVVLTGNRATVVGLHKIATNLGLCPSYIHESMVNEYYSFFIPPDGSKEGWPESNAMDKAREEFIREIKSLGWQASWFHAEFAGDDRQYNILDHSGLYFEDEEEEAYWKVKNLSPLEAAFHRNNLLI